MAIAPPVFSRTETRKKSSPRQRILRGVALGTLLFSSWALGQTVGSLWNRYSTQPNTDPNVPNNSFAGYHRGEVVIPKVPVVVDVTSYGAKGDGVTDNTTAFKNAIAACAQKGGGAVWVPAGDFLVKGIIRLNNSGVVLRGAGRTSTNLIFPNPLRTTVQNMDYVCPDSPQCSEWAWQGGSIWISPSDEFDSSGKLRSFDGKSVAPSVGDWQSWRSGGYQTGPRLANVSPALRGQTTLTVDSAASLKAGQWYLLTWTPDTTNYELWKHIAGNARMATFDWSKAKWLNAFHKYRWPVQILAVNGKTVTIAQPLRIDIRAIWNVGFEPIGTYVQEIGVEDLTIQEVGAPKQVAHHANPGWNGVFLNRAINCWVRNVTIKNAENGILMRYVKNNTATDFTIQGDVLMHHGTTSAVADDNLFQNFTLDSPVRHGISTEALSSGQVWSNGKMTHGTFDSHRIMAFDFIHTQIQLYNDGGPGGGDDMGPYEGKNVVNWNVQVTGPSGKYVYMPDLISNGALVGMRAPRDNSCAPAMICGDKNAIIEQDGKIPTPANLYQSQLQQRLAAMRSIQITKPYEGMIIASATAYCKAQVAVGTGAPIARVEFYNGSKLLGTVKAAPYEYYWNNLTPGSYAVTAKAIGTDNSVMYSPPSRFTIVAKTTAS